MITRVSKIYWPKDIIPKDAIIKNDNITSKSQKLMLELGLIKSTGNGTFHILPIAQRSIDKCIKLICEYMNEIDGQKITLPILTSAELWKKSGRLNQNSNEFFTLRDRHEKMHILSPTHEESVTSLIAMSSPISYKQLPLKLYQIGSKFRDEFKPRFGLMRTKEFIMKDLYSFDCDNDAAEKTYNQINSAYEKLLNALEISWVKVNGSTGMMGGKISHEYHIPSKIGEDNLLKCSKCSFAANAELYMTESEISSSSSQILCPSCENPHSTITTTKGIEVAHSFLLQDKYSKPLNATFLKSDGKPQHLIMGCYGIGVTRLVAAAIETLSTENEIRWPYLLAPYKICVIPPKEGSKEQKLGEELLERILHELKTNIYGDHEEVLIDDRTHLTIGKRLMDCKKIGYPRVLVIGNKCMDVNPKFELHCLTNDTRKDLEFPELLAELHGFEETFKRNRIFELM